MKKKLLILIFVLAILGIIDSGYLTWEHFGQAIPPCSIHWWIDCGKVLKSSYAEWRGIPVAVFGMTHYFLILGLSSVLLQRHRSKIGWWLLVQAGLGLIFSVYFVLLQLFVLHALCLYCMASALISTAIFLTVLNLIKDKRTFSLWLLAVGYKVCKRIFFLIDAEVVHTLMVRFGEKLGGSRFLMRIFSSIFNPPLPTLTQRIAGTQFATPIGLAAGFDYEARLTQVLYSWGFGLQTIGTITNHACAGNHSPRLGRLPLSQALLVNKGFKNPGAKAVIHKLAKLIFHIPVGISVGQTNSIRLKSQNAAIEDILANFKLFEESSVCHQYYELNISCPNLRHNFNFYNPTSLDQLLMQVDDLSLQKPVFIKMPISESDETVMALLKVISKHSPVGVIIGNLQKNRLDPAVVASERHNMGPGNLSGKPTFDRSNHLIALTYRHYRRRLVIIGCGGVFTPEDAYLKICLGASLIQMITGMIFQGPQVIAQINQGLDVLLQKDNFTSISQAIGSKNLT